jgi:elongation factor P
MATYNMNQVRVGVKILMDNAPCIVVDTDVVKPGKGQAFTRVRYKNYVTGSVNQITMKSSDSVEAADVHETEMQYLYSDGDMWTFMDQVTFEQISATSATVGTASQWLKEEDICTVTLFEGNPIVIAPPTFVVLEVTETDPGLKGDTSSGGNKPATVETGAVVRVPLFVQIGEKLKIDTRTGDYVSRA